MKKITALLMALLMVLSMSAAFAESNPYAVTEPITSPATEPVSEPTSDYGKTDISLFTYRDTIGVYGTSFKEFTLPSVSIVGDKARDL